MTQRNPDISVRRATADDAQTLATVGAAAFTEAYGASSSAHDLAHHLETHFSLTAIIDALTHPDTQYLLAFFGNQAAGLAKLHIDSPHRALPTTNVLKLDQLYVSPTQQRRGVGAVLMEHVIATANEQGHEGIWLSVWSKADWAIRFYEAVGFAKIGTVPFTIGKTDYIDDLMWRPTYSGTAR